VEGLYYAGSHGCDVEGPPGSGISLREGEEFRPELVAVTAEVRAALQGTRGVVVENKGISVGVHYRQVTLEDQAFVQEVVEASARLHPLLVLTRGKKLLELRPSALCDKGRLVTWMTGALGLAAAEVFPVCVGDDLTDEDAFRAVRGWGAGVRIVDEPGSTDAEYFLATADDVVPFLSRFLRLPPGRVGVVCAPPGGC
jgi:trehalose 6-phosphate phosphatase